MVVILIHTSTRSHPTIFMPLHPLTISKPCVDVNPPISGVPAIYNILMGCWTHNYIYQCRNIYCTLKSDLKLQLNILEMQFSNCLCCWLAGNLAGCLDALEMPRHYGDTRIIMNLYKNSLVSYHYLFFGQTIPVPGANDGSRASISKLM